MINILALLKSQPITGLESNSIALIKGFAPKTTISNIVIIDRLNSE
jgi:hypothetical protein